MPEPLDTARCPWAINIGLDLHTRCDWPAGHEGGHEGPGLAEFPYQRIEWSPRDRREYQTDRDEPAAWEEPRGVLTDEAWAEVGQRVDAFVRDAERSGLSAVVIWDRAHRRIDVQLVEGPEQ